MKYPPSPTITIDRVNEIKKLFMNSALNQAWGRNHNICKFHQLFQKLLVMGMGGEGALHLRFLFCEIVCHWLSATGGAFF